MLEGSVEMTRCFLHCKWILNQLSNRDAEARSSLGQMPVC